MTSKTDKELNKYYGSNKEVMAWEDPAKAILHEYEKKSECRLMELLLQLHYRFDERMMNGVFNIRLFRKHVTKVDKDHEFEIYQSASTLLELWELGCPYAVRGREELLLLMSDNKPN